MPSAWLRRNVFHPCEGGPLLRAIYLATLVWPTSMPSLRSSPWILGAPHNGLATLIWRISWRISTVTAGRPQRCFDFHRQYDPNPARCQRTTVSGRTISSPRRTRFQPTRRADRAAARTGELLSQRPAPARRWSASSPDRRFRLREAARDRE